MIKIHIASTPNGRKPLLALEEIGAPYKSFPVDLGRLSSQLQRPEGERNMEMIKVFADEVDRLIGVLDRVLSDSRQFLVGEFSIADIMHYPWLQPVLALAAPQLMERPRVVEWLCRIADRPATQRVYDVA